MNEIEALWQRHSVRSYKPLPIGTEALQSLRACIAECNEAGGLHLQLLENAGGTFHRIMSRAMGLASAPSVIACAGPDSPELEERIGYWGERAVLCAQMLGLNTCWAGTFSAKQTPAALREGERLVIVIAVGYGTAPGKARRSRTPEEVSAGPAEPPEWFTAGVRYALQAPTAINQQKFFFRLREDGTVEAADRGGPFSAVDLGIVKYHFDLARREAGLPPLWD